MVNCIVLVGDLLTIVVFMFLSGLGVPYHDTTTSIPWLPGFCIDTLPYLLIWSLIGHYFDGSRNSKQHSIPWKRLFLGWGVTALISGMIHYLIVRFIIPDLFSQVAKPGFPLTKIASIIVLGWVTLFLWRLMYHFLRRISESERYLPLRRSLSIAGSVFVFISVMGIAIHLYTNVHFSNRMIARNEAPASDLGIVFGAGVSRDGFPSSPLMERMSTAAALYNSGALDKLLLSSGVSYGYSEAEIMMEMALELGVPQDALMIDRNGIHTLQTCMNARAFMDDGNSVALITHEYHLPRAMMVCDLLGIDSIGVIAEQGYYPPQVLFIWRVRECFASLYAFLRLIL